MTRQDRLFVKYIQEQCDIHGVILDLRPVKYMRLHGKMHVGGYFIEQNRVLACSTKDKNFIYTLVHEYSHMLQWIDQYPNVDESIVKMDKWLNGTNVDDIDYHIDIIRDMELDAEKRAVNVIQEHDINIDIPEYIKKANIYIQFHNYMKTSRRWIGAVNPMKNDRILSAVPDRFTMKYSKMSKKLHELFVEEGV